MVKKPHTDLSKDIDLIAIFMKSSLSLKRQTQQSQSQKLPVERPQLWTYAKVLRDQNCFRPFYI